MSEAWFGILGVAVVGLVTGAVTLWRERLAFRRDREARLEDREVARQGRRDDFELETLLALQDVTSELRQAVFRDYERKMGMQASKAPGRPGPQV